MTKKINFLFVTLFGIGKISKIPGSIASLVTVIFLFIVLNIFNFPPDIFLTIIGVIFFFSSILN